MSQQPNPFYHRTPIQDPAYFFGRAHELRQLCALITNGQSVSLIGPRRIGKSSLLQQLCRPLVQTAHGLVAGAQTIVYFSGEAWQDQPVAVLYAALWGAIIDEVRATTEASLLPDDLPDPAVGTLDFPTFQRALRQVGQSNRQLVLLLDEFDALSRNRNLDEIFFSSLRSLAATQGIVFITASIAPLLELTYGQQSALSSPFFNIFLPHRLGLLSHTEARALLQGTAAIGGLALSAEEAQQLLRLAGPHPCFLQIAGYHFWEARQVGLDADLAYLQQVILAEVTPHLVYQWRYLAGEEQRAVALLPFTQPTTPAQQMRLQQSCLVQGVREALTLLSPLIEAFVRQQQIHQILQAGPLLIDQQRQEVWLAGRVVTLSPQDYRLLTALATDAGQTLRHAELAGQLWPEEATAINHQTRLKTAVNSLRRKLGEQERLIATDPTGGYRFVPDLL